MFRCRSSTRLLTVSLLRVCWRSRTKRPEKPTLHGERRDDPPSSAMRIVLETALNKGPAEYQNMGDVSMLQVAARRVRCLWPDASIEVLTDSPENLHRY